MTPTKTQFKSIIHVGFFGTLIVSISLSTIFFLLGESSYPLAWRFYLLSAILLATWGFKESALLRHLSACRSELITLLAVLVIGAFFRLYLIDTYPYGIWADEAENILVAQRIATYPEYRPLFITEASQLPALPFYYYSIFVTFFGANILAIRLSVTLVGLAALISTWALARELFGKRAALIAAALQAVCIWHINFSRFAVANIFITFFAPLALFFFIRSQRRKNYGDGILAGILLGFGLQTYYAILALPLLFIGILIHRWMQRKSVSIKNFVIAVGITTIVYSPVIIYASSNWEQFSKRMSTVSTFSPTQALRTLLTSPTQLPALLAPLREPTIKHLRMFHFEGDSNGRHNLPGAPMLDRISGVLFVLGLAWTLIHLYRWEYSFLVVWFLINISAGIFSLAFEAPQGARTLGLTSIIPILCALPLTEMAKNWSLRVWQIGRVILFVLCFFGSGYLAFQAFFVEKRFDFSSFAAYATPETYIGYKAKEWGNSVDLYVPEAWNGGPTQQVLRGDSTRNIPFLKARDLPLVNRGRDAAVVISGQDPDSLNAVRAIYPEAKIEEFGSPMNEITGSTNILHTAYISQEVLEKASTFALEIRKDGKKVYSTSVNTLDLDWSQFNIAAPFEAIIEGNYRLNRDQKSRFNITSSAPTQIFLDREEIFSENSKSLLTLVQGSHYFQLHSCVTSADQKTAVNIFDPVTQKIEPFPRKSMYQPYTLGGGLTGNYIEGLDPLRSPTFSRIDSTIDFYFHLLPLPRPFTVVWRGSLMIPKTGTYRLGVSSNDPAYVQLDGKSIAANTIPLSTTFGSADVVAGLHPLTLTYQSSTDAAQVYLYWIKPDGVKSIIPASQLFPLSPTGKEIIDLPTFKRCG